MEGFYEGFLRGKRGRTEFGSKIEMFVISGVRNIESSLTVYMKNFHGNNFCDWAHFENISLK